MRYNLKHLATVLLLFVIVAAYLSSDADALPRSRSRSRSRRRNIRPGGTSESKFRVTSAKGGTRTVFARRGSFGKGGKTFGKFSREQWKAALLAGLAVSSVVRGRGPNNIIVFNGAREYINSDRGRQNLAPTVCYNDERKDDNGTVLYYFLCPKNDAVGDEEYCCDKNDNQNKQYCCSRDEWSPLIKSTKGTTLGSQTDTTKTTTSLPIKWTTGEKITRSQPQTINTTTGTAEAILIQATHLFVSIAFASLIFLYVSRNV